MQRTLIVIAATLVAAWALHPGGTRTVVQAAAPGAVQELTAADRAATYTFAPSVTELNRRAFVDATGRARPEARRLFDAVDGLVTVEDGRPPAGALGVTIPEGGRFTIRFSFGAVYQRLGQRGFDRLVDHELGHVVDMVLVDDALDRTLDDGIPPGQPCSAGMRTGSCAPQAERFAETFAKWANGDLGEDVYAGYAVPPPPNVEVWGRPLLTLPV